MKMSVSSLWSSTLGTDDGLLHLLWETMFRFYLLVLQFLGLLLNFFLIIL